MRQFLLESDGMKRKIQVSLVLCIATLLAACNRPAQADKPTGWVLNGYDEQKGFFFLKDKYVYRMVCYSKGIEYLTPTLARGNQDCVGVLSFMGQLIPLEPFDATNDYYSNLFALRRPGFVKDFGVLPPLVFKIVEIYPAPK